jgi:hypothetical protein
MVDPVQTFLFVFGIVIAVFGVYLVQVSFRRSSPVFAIWGASCFCCLPRPDARTKAPNPRKSSARR